MTEIKGKIVLGVDVTQDKLDIWDASQDKHYAIENNKRKIGAWLKTLLKSQQTIEVILEPKDGYENTLLKQLVKHAEVKQSVNRLLKLFKKELQLIEGEIDKLLSKER